MNLHSRKEAQYIYISTVRGQSVMVAISVVCACAGAECDCGPDVGDHFQSGNFLRGGWTQTNIRAAPVSTLASTQYQCQWRVPLGEKNAKKLRACQNRNEDIVHCRTRQQYKVEN